MFAYFARRLLGGIVALLFATFIPFAYLTEEWRNPSRTTVGHPRTPSDPIIELKLRLRHELYIKLVHVDKPLPYNYIDWIFDLDCPDLGYIEQENVGRAIDQLVQWRDYTRPSGVITGYLGYSLVFYEGSSVSELIGTGWWLIPLTMLALTLCLMVVATLQRWRRPPPYRATYAPIVGMRDRSHLGRLSVFI